MPSRRTLLTGASAAAVSALAGCSLVENGGSLRRATHGDDPRVPDDASPVAADETWLDAHPNGTFAVLMTGFERERTDGTTELLVDTRLRLIPGRNQSSTDWTLAGFALEHDYDPLDSVGPVDHEGSYVPAGADGDGSKIRMAREHRTEDLSARSRWRVRYDQNGSTWGPEFRTRIPLDESPADGDELADARVRVQTRKWPFATDERELGASIAYGEDRRE